MCSIDICKKHFFVLNDRWPIQLQVIGTPTNSFPFNMVWQFVLLFCYMYYSFPMPVLAINLECNYQGYREYIYLKIHFRVQMFQTIILKCESFYISCTLIIFLFAITYFRHSSHLVITENMDIVFKSSIHHCINLASLFLCQFPQVGI